MLTRDSLASLCNLAVEKVELPSGDFAFVRAMTGAERDNWEAEQYNRNKAGTQLDNFRARFVVRCLSDESGALLFRVDEAESIGKLPVPILHKLFEASQKVNHATTEELEELQKN